MEEKCGFCLFLGTILHRNGQKNVKKRKKMFFKKSPFSEMGHSN